MSTDTAKEPELGVELGKAIAPASKADEAEKRSSEASKESSEKDKKEEEESLYKAIGLGKEEGGRLKRWGWDEDDDGDIVGQAQAAEDRENAMDITSADLDLELGLDGADGGDDDAEIMKEILATADLKQFCRDVERQLRGVDHEAVPEYLREVGNFTALYREIGACDALLGEFEKSLSAFQGVLLSINSDIKSLQESSVRTTQKIENRRAASARIEDFVGRIFVTRTVRESLQKLSPGDPGFYPRLADFNEKLAYFELVMEEYTPPPRVCLELKPKYDSLREQVGWKVQGYFQRALAGVTPSAGAAAAAAAASAASVTGGGGSKAITIANANGSSSSSSSSSNSTDALRSAQAVLLRDARTYQFLFKHTPERAAELRERYTGAAAQYYEAYMRRYTSALQRYAIDAGAPRKEDMLGALESHHRQRLTRSLFTSAAAASSLQAARTVNVFALGTRCEDLLAHMADPPMPASGGGSAAADEHHPFEELWRSALRALVDAAVVETLFVQDFFLAQQDVAEVVLARPAGALEDFLAKHLASSYDAIGIALMACVSERYNAVALRRNVACLGELHRRCAALLGARYALVMEAHAESLRKAAPDTVGSVTAVAAPHFITRRFAEFLAALLTIAGPAAKAPAAAAAMIKRALDPLGREFERTLLRFAQSLRDPVLQTIFLMNNYDLVLVLLREHGLDATPEAARFRDLFQTCLQTFQDSVVISNSAFRSIAAYLDEMRPLVADAGASEALLAHPHYSPEYVVPIIRDFHDSWRKVVDSVLSDVLKYFSNFETGQETCSAVFKKLFGLYKEFLDFIRANFKELLRSKFLVSETEIRYELKKLGISQ